MAEISDLNVTDGSNTDRFPEGQNPSTVNNGARALEGIIARWFSDINGTVAVAGTDTYTATINADSGFSLYDGYMFCGDFANANTGAATLNLTPDGGSALGAASIVKNGSAALVSGDIAAGQKVVLRYDGTNFQMLSPTANQFTDPITTRGDVIRGDSSGNSERLALGADNTVLASDGTDAAWETFLSLMAASISSTQGDITYHNGTNWVNLGAGTSGQFLQTQGAAANPQWAGTSVVNRWYAEDGTVATGTNSIPLDDTIPQNTEGDQYLSLTTGTLASSSNRLRITVTLNVASSSGLQLAVALFNGNANAIAAVGKNPGGANVADVVTFQHEYAPGATTAVTFTVRASANSGTLTVNGVSGSRRFGGVNLSSIVVEELTP